MQCSQHARNPSFLGLKHMERERRKICHFDSLYGKCVQRTLGAYCSINNNATGRFIMGDHKENMTVKNIKDPSICKVSLKQISARGVIGKASIGKSPMGNETVLTLTCTNKSARCNAMPCFNSRCSGNEVGKWDFLLGGNNCVNVLQGFTLDSLKASWLSLLCASRSRVRVLEAIHSCTYWFQWDRLLLLKVVCT